jgi:hypothetical protein
MSPVLLNCLRLKYRSTPAATHIRTPKRTKIRVNIIVFSSL